MSNHLTDEQIERFSQQGFLSPLAAFSAAEARDLRTRLEAIEASRPDPSSGSLASSDSAAVARANLPVAYGWAWDLVHDERVVAPVTDLLGPDVLLWSMDWFIKEPGTRFVSWHQDATYWGLAPHHVVTAWVALSDAAPATGPMKFLPGSHRGPLYEQDDTFAEDNMLSRGQTVRAQLDESTAVLAPLELGQMSLHHVRIVHGSDPNTTHDRRIGMVLRYCATDVRQTKVEGDRAVLVAGQDRYGHFDLVQRPARDLGPDERERRRALGRTRHRALHSMDYEEPGSNN